MLFAIRLSKMTLIICIILIICAFAGITIWTQHNDYHLNGDEYIWPWFAYLFLIIALIVCIVLLFVV